MSLFFITNRGWKPAEKKFNHDRDEMSYGEVKTDGAESVAIERYGPDGRAVLAQKLASFAQCFLLIHGYNATFREASIKFLEFSRLIAVEQNGAGGPMAFVMLSWPSEGVSIRGIIREAYEADRRRVKKSVPDFVEAIKFLLYKFPKKTHIMGHSMGGLLLWRCMKGITKAEQQNFGRVMWMAADVRKNHVQERFLGRVFVPATNYLNRGDRALRFSNINAGGHQRMGASSTKLHGTPDHAKQPLVNVKVSSQSAFLVDPDHRHTYFTLHSVVRDIVMQITTDKTPLERGLIARDSKKGFKIPKAPHQPTLYSVHRLRIGTDNFYTNNPQERKVVRKSRKAKDYGVEFWTMRQQAQQPGLVPFHRFLASKEHFYTIHQDEGVRAGFRHEGNIGFVLPATIERTNRWTELHRYYNGATRDHLYLVEKAEGDDYVRDHGYTYEGVACLVIV